MPTPFCSAGRDCRGLAAGFAIALCATAFAPNATTAVADRLRAREDAARGAGKSVRALVLYRENVRDAHQAAVRSTSPRDRALAVVHLLPYEMRAALMLALRDRCGERPAIRVAVQDAMRFDLATAADRDFEQARLADGFRAYRRRLFPAPRGYGFNAVFLEPELVTNLKAGLDAAAGGRFDDARRIFAAQERAVPALRYPSLFVGVLRMRAGAPDAAQHLMKVLEIPSPAEPDSPGYDAASISALVLLASPSLNGCGS